MQRTPVPLSTDPAALKAYQSAFEAAQKIAARVDVMRWQSLVYYAKYRSAVRLNSEEAEAAKLVFVEGFEAGQDNKVLRQDERSRFNLRRPS